MHSPHLLLATALALSAGMSAAYKGPNRGVNRQSPDPAQPPYATEEIPCGGGPSNNDAGTDDPSPVGDCFVLWVKFQAIGNQTVADEVVITPGRADPGNFWLAPARSDRGAARAILQLAKAGATTTATAATKTGGRVVLAYLAEPRFPGLVYTYLTPKIVNDKLLPVTPNLGKVGAFTFGPEAGPPLICLSSIGDVLEAGDLKAPHMTDSCASVEVTADRADCRTGDRLDPKAGPPKQAPTEA